MSSAPVSPTPPQLSTASKLNFKSILRAAHNKELALVSAIRKSDGKPVALVCAMQENSDGTMSPVPFAVMIEGNPYEDFRDPG